MENKKIFYQNFIGNSVRVKCNDSTFYVGKMISIDGYLNIVIENPLFYISETTEPLKYKSIFIKGANVDYISLESK
ncbi:LSM domain-containing protein [Hamiltosporidium magnivora]|uniref:LSM domain-containing protein n=1 Tax=Hamiltosporidium magnivora TaxID=148818 RepID=A0A4Q9KWU7_9MICR|nr:LSM domain-containing protein [Hamiltosporidium magnivora]TBT99402.1 LSM domain-containing protein [Hamiltosporidium magnivora]